VAEVGWAKERKYMKNWMGRLADGIGFVDLFPVKAETPEEAVALLVSQDRLFGLEWRFVGEKRPLAEDNPGYFCFRSEWKGILYIWAVKRKTEGNE
jgi:hypothetical protein